MERKSLPKISIVTPSFNQGEFIEETILSIINQNYPNLEYIIIDGGSTDDTVEIIKKYEKWITYWVSEPDKGQSDAINKGLAKCTGDVFNWINSDDFYEQGALNRIGELFVQDNVHVVCGYSKRFYNENNKMECLVRTILYQSLEQSLILHHFRQPSTFFRLSKIKELNGVSPYFKFVMDSELFIRYLLSYGKSNFLFINDVLVNFRLHKESKTVSSAASFRKEYSLVIYSLLSSSRVPHKLFPKVDTNALLNANLKYNLRKINLKKLSAYYLLHQSYTSSKRSILRKVYYRLLAVMYYPMILIKSNKKLSDNPHREY